MSILLNTEFLIPVMIGAGCLAFSARILVGNNKDEDEHSQDDIKEERTDDDFESLQAPKGEPLEPGRKFFYFLLFAGLGAASVTHGFASLYPFLTYVTKGIIALTIIASIATNTSIDKKLQTEENGEIEPTGPQQEPKEKDIGL